MTQYISNKYYNNEISLNNLLFIKVTWTPVRFLTDS